jgi:AAA+ ATPase superfamily predicted ATPase
MFQQFIDREEEVRMLEERFGSGAPEFIMIYGRRRVGKTELVSQFIKGKPCVYFLAEEKRYADNLDEMKGIMGDALKDEEFKLIRFENWVQIFKGFLARARGRTIVVIDEFPYLVAAEKAVPSEFQKIWDMHLSKSDTMLVLVGSSVSMMEKLLGRKSPLFGRRTAQIEIKPVDVFRVKEFLPDYPMRERIRAYGCADGIPLYLRQFNSKLTFFDNVKNSFLRRDALLYAEAEILLKQEFREPANYFAILKAISFGNERQNEIANYTGIDKSIISKYLQNLEEVRIVKREYPVTERKERRGSARYVFSDNYFRFWFRFV